MADSWNMKISEQPRAALDYTELPPQAPLSGPSHEPMSLILNPSRLLANEPVYGNVDQQHGQTNK